MASFCAVRKRLRWFYEDSQGASAIFPEKYGTYVSLIPEAERGDMIGAYYRQLTSNDEAVRLEAAKAWALWEGSALRLIPDQKLIEDFTEPDGKRSQSHGLSAITSSTTASSKPTII